MFNNKWMENSRRDLSNEQLLQNFNSMVFRCIECGGANFSRTGPNVLEKEIEDDAVVCEQFTEVKKAGDAERVARFVVTCLICQDCGRKFSVTVLDHG